jgi:hypothetical protein
LLDSCGGVIPIAEAGGISKLATFKDWGASTGREQPVVHKIISAFTKGKFPAASPEGVMPHMAIAVHSGD